MKDIQEFERRVEKAIAKLKELVRPLNDECPFCHTKLKIRLRKIHVYVSVEGELHDDGLFAGYGIPLEELKKLLGEV